MELKALLEDNSLDIFEAMAIIAALVEDTDGHIQENIQEEDCFIVYPIKKSFLWKTL